MREKKPIYKSPFIHSSMHGLFSQGHRGRLRPIPAVTAQKPGVNSGQVTRSITRPRIDRQPRMLTSTPSVINLHSMHVFAVWEKTRVPTDQWAGSGVHPGRVTSPWRGHTETDETNNHARSHFSPTDHLEPPINITWMFLDCERKQSTQRKFNFSLQTEKKNPVRTQTGNFLTVREQYQPPHHNANRISAAKWRETARISASISDRCLQRQRVQSTLGPTFTDFAVVAHIDWIQSWSAVMQYSGAHVNFCRVSVSGAPRWSCRPHIYRL